MKFDFRFLSGKTGVPTGIAGDDEQIIVDGLSGKYYQANRKYSVFSQTTTPLGVAIPIYTSVTPLGNLLWNPASNNKKAVLVKYRASRVSGTAAVFSAFLMARNQVGSVVASAAAAGQFTAFADTVAVNGQLGVLNALAGQGGGPTSSMRSSKAGTCTFTAGVAAEAIEVLGGTGIEADATANGISYIDVDFDGRIEVFPGTVIWVAATLASVALYAQTLSWIEQPL